MPDTSDLKESAQKHAKELGAQAKAAATQKAVAQADQLKQTAADTAQRAADAADVAAQKLDSASPQAQAVQQVADHIEGVAAKLRTADVRQLADQATEMARRNPLLFIGGAAVAGFAAARFLKARDPRPLDRLHADDPWGASTRPRTETADRQMGMADTTGGRGRG